MRTQNICKFPEEQWAGSLTVSSYVREAQPDIMRIPFVLQKDRLILVAQGRGRFTFDGTPLVGQAGDVLFGLKGERFMVTDCEGAVYFYMDFCGSRGEELLRRFRISRAHRQFAGQKGLIPLWEESLSGASEQTVDLASESMLLYTFSRLFSEGGERNGLVEQILCETEANFTDPSLSIAVIAERLCYNPKYLSHLFKEKNGVNYTEYLRSLRIKYAVSLFDHGIDSVKNVALLSGFTDPLYFSGVFKRAIGVSPKDYLRRQGIDQAEDRTQTEGS